jgi:hypothetical protein
MMTMLHTLASLMQPACSVAIGLGDVSFGPLPWWMNLQRGWSALYSQLVSHPTYGSVHSYQDTNRLTLRNHYQDDFGNPSLRPCFEPTMG